MLTRSGLGADVLVCGCYEPESILSGAASKDSTTAPGSCGARRQGSSTALGKGRRFVLASDHWDSRMKTPGNAEFVERFRRSTAASRTTTPPGRTAGCRRSKRACARRARSTRTDPAGARGSTCDDLPGAYRGGETGGQIGKTSIIVQWQGGKKEILWPGEAAANVLPAPPWAERR
jgi:hypothetical protein